MDSFSPYSAGYNKSEPRARRRREPAGVPPIRVVLTRAQELDARERLIQGMHILGIVTRTHDAGLALLNDGVPTIVLEEERFNREKHTRKFPFFSLEAVFDDNGPDIKDIDVITTPWNMASLRRTMFNAVTGKLPASLNLLWPSANPTQSTLLINMPMGLRWGLMLSLIHI